MLKTSTKPSLAPGIMRPRATMVSAFYHLSKGKAMPDSTSVFTTPYEGRSSEKTVKISAGES